MPYFLIANGNSEKKPMTNVNFVNLTPHAIHVEHGVSDEDESAILTIPPSGQVCRVEPTYKPGDSVDGIETAYVAHGDLVGLPDQVAGTYYIVSLLCLDSIEGRPDVLAPDTGSSCVRENGQIKYVTRFLRKE